MLSYLVGCSLGLSAAVSLDPGGAATGPICINEVQPKNDSTWQAEDGELPDWVELLNRSSVPIALDRVSLTSGPARWDGPADEELGPGEYRLVLAESGPDALPYSLSNEGEALVLELDGLRVDQVEWQDLGSDQTWARFPDGSPFAVTGRPTPGAPNGDAPGITDPTDDLFQISTISRIDLQLSDASVQSLRSDGGTEVPAAFTFQGVTFDDVNIRIKGGYGSKTSFDQKPSFKIDLDDHTPHRLRGLEKLTFNNFWQDASALHEYLAYGLFREEGHPAPRVGFAWITVNGDDFGLYAWIESVDDQFLQRWYDDPTGNLYEGAYGVDFNPGAEASFELDEGVEDRSDLTAVIDVLQGAPDDAGIVALDQVVDLDEFLAECAWEAATLHWDGYESSNNYRVYDDPSTGRFQIIPWGTDQTFDSLQYGVWDSGGRLMQFCLQNEGCRARYGRAVAGVADAMEQLDPGSRIDGLDRWLEPYWRADDRLDWGSQDHASEIEVTRTWIDGGPDRLRKAL